ncbi:DUF4129 domain-containing protein [Nocardioides nanhaiensis]|uniref:DUF4129 domain-containing protein n=1 Tax=Nocardioides nanhaiensis TaxID=1476871 RepID=UPI0031EFDCBF
MTPPLRVGADGVPLTPTPDEARSELRRELLRPEYNDENLLDRVLRWVERRLDAALDVASSAPPLTTLAAMLVLAGLVAAAAWLVSRQRSSARQESRAGSVLGEERATAAQLRRRAEEALAQERYAEAVVEGFRALALRQVERGLVEDAPGLTAQDVARALAAEFPDRAHAVGAGARLFDEVLYGDREATLPQATEVLALDDELAVAR